MHLTNFSPPSPSARARRQLVSLRQLSEPLEVSPTPETTGRRGRGSGRERDDDKPKTFADLLTQIQNKVTTRSGGIGSRGGWESDRICETRNYVGVIKGM